MVREVRRQAASKETLELDELGKQLDQADRWKAGRLADEQKKVGQGGS